MDLNHYLNTVETAASLSRRMDDINPVYLSQYRRGVRRMPPAFCVRLESVTGGQVTRPESRPHDWSEIWPDLVTA